PLKPGKARRGKRIGEDADDAALGLGQYVDGVFPGHVRDRLPWTQREDSANLATPPAKRVDVVDAAIDEGATARIRCEAPPRMPAPAASDHVHLAHVSEEAPVERTAHPAEG